MHNNRKTGRYVSIKDQSKPSLISLLQYSRYLPVLKSTWALPSQVEWKVISEFPRSMSDSPPALKFCDKAYPLTGFLEHS
jgi:hypothetical protein